MSLFLFTNTYVPYIVYKDVVDYLFFYLQPLYCGDLWG